MSIAQRLLARLRAGPHLRENARGLLLATLLDRVAPIEATGDSAAVSR